MTWLVSFWGLEKGVERVAASGLLESFDVAIVDGKVVLSFEVDGVADRDADIGWVLRDAVEALVERVNSVLKLVHGMTSTGFATGAQHHGELLAKRRTSCGSSSTRRDLTGTAMRRRTRAKTARGRLDLQRLMTSPPLMS